MICASCGRDEELRLGFCFDCATAGEKRAAHRTVLQHCAKGFHNVFKRHWTSARICFQWARERFTRTGDYAPRGIFEEDYGIKLPPRRFFTKP